MSLIKKADVPNYLSARRSKNLLLLKSVIRPDAAGNEAKRSGAGASAEVAAIKKPQA